MISEKYNRSEYKDDEVYSRDTDVPGTGLHDHYKPGFYRENKRNSCRPKRMHDTTMFYNDDTIGNIITSREKINNYITYGDNIEILTELFNTYKDDFDISDHILFIRNENITKSVLDELYDSDYKESLSDKVLDILSNRK